VAFVVGTYFGVELVLIKEDDEVTAVLEDEVEEIEVLLLLAMIGPLEKVVCPLGADNGDTDVGDGADITGVVAEVTSVLEDKELATEALLLLLLPLVARAVAELAVVPKDEDTEIEVLTLLPLPLVSRLVAELEEEEIEKLVLPLLTEGGVGEVQNSLMDVMVAVTVTVTAGGP
jgi:hypothetical protein